jgi:transposase-like protein
VKTLDEILEKIERKEVSVARISRETGIVANNIYGWVAKRGKPKGEDFVKLQNWFDKYKGNVTTFTPINNTESPNLESLIRQNENLTQANKDLAHANMNLSANLLELTKRLNSSESQERILSDHAKRSEVLELLAPIVKGSLGLEFPTDESAALELDRRLTDIENRTLKVGKNTSLGKKDKTL